VRAVIDTNVLVAGLLWHGNSHALLEHVRSGAVSIVSSETLLTELDEVMARPKFDSILSRSALSREKMLTQIRELVELLQPPPLPKPVCRDPDDDHVLALAVAARAEVIVSGDVDLLSLQSFESIPILSPADFLSRLTAGGSP
jgi:putative PIN family toxin of toxin-antitoxin system